MTTTARAVVPAPSAAAAEWWKTAVVYQIYPRSFQDSNGDGVGDLAGIVTRLDAMVALGVDAIWISPIFPSPMADFGYDVSDYCGIDPMFGTLEDFDHLVAAAHERGLKVILDFVPSHSSDQHPWFVESRSSRDNPKRDWYIWRDAKPDGSAPNNWISEFGGPAWTWDPATQQYFLHIFLPDQPALNWRNPEVRAAMLDSVRFWYDRGVDGFRVDAIGHVAPDADGGDHPANPDWLEHMGPARSHIQIHAAHQPLAYEIVREMRAITEAYPDRVLIGETCGTLDQVMSYYGEELDAFHMPFNFALLQARWDAATIAGIVDTYEAALPAGAWPNWVLGNHDCGRIASRAGRDQARVAATLLLTLRGTPTLYQGDELGMESAPIRPEEVQDPWEKRVPGLGLGRDPARTPIPWEEGATAGFTTGKPWLPVHLPRGGTAAAQAADPDSMLSFVRALLALRRDEPALSLGDYRTLAATDGVYGYERRLGDRAVTVWLNFTGEAKPLPAAGKVMLSSDPARDRAAPATALAPNEALILEG